MLNSKGKPIQGLPYGIEFFGKTFGERWRECLNYAIPYSMGHRFHGADGGLTTMPLLVVMLHAIKFFSEKEQVDTVRQYFEEIAACDNDKIWVNRHSIDLLLRLSSINEKMVLLALNILASHPAIAPRLAQCSKNDKYEKFIQIKNRIPMVGVGEPCMDYDPSKDALRWQELMTMKKLFLSGSTPRTQLNGRRQAISELSSLQEGSWPKRTLAHWALIKITAALAGWTLDEFTTKADEYNVWSYVSENYTVKY